MNSFLYLLYALSLSSVRELRYCLYDLHFVLTFFNNPLEIHDFVIIIVSFLPLTYLIGMQTSKVFYVFLWKQFVGGICTLGFMDEMPTSIMP